MIVVCITTIGSARSSRVLLCSQESCTSSLDTSLGLRQVSRGHTLSGALKISLTQPVVCQTTDAKLSKCSQEHPGGSHQHSLWDLQPSLRRLPRHQQHKATPTPAACPLNQPKGVPLTAVTSAPSTTMVFENQLAANPSWIRTQLLLVASCSGAPGEKRRPYVPVVYGN
jgi:hypothetical protein